MKKHNFSSGPSILPASTIEGAANAVKEWDDFGGLSLIEVSHRSPAFVAVVDEAVQSIKDLLNVPSNYDVVFLHGGASLQFCMIPYNLLKEAEKALYLDTGTWSSKAIKEAKLFGDTEVIASSKADNFNHIPTFEINNNDAISYLHITTNNTIYGTQIYQDVDTNVPLIADMSSDIFSRPIDVSKYDIIYAGAQKNLGPAGVSIAIIKQGILGKTARSIPSMLNYQTHIDKDSMFNTPPVFAIYTSLLTLRWLKENGGVEAMKDRNEVKAKLLYDEIDRHPLFEGTANKADRSKMNVTFILKDKAFEEAFLAFCESKGISGIKGHRSVGGFRASIYNAMSIESVQHLVNCIQEFKV